MLGFIALGVYVFGCFVMLHQALTKLFLKLVDHISNISNLLLVDTTQKFRTQELKIAKLQEEIMMLRNIIEQKQ